MTDVANTMLVPVSMFMVQMGSRHLSPTFTTIQKKLFATPLFQTVVVFAIFFNMTRKIESAAMMTLLFYLVIFVILNENHPMNWLPRSWLKKEGFNKGSVDIYDVYQENIKGRVRK